MSMAPKPTKKGGEQCGAGLYRLLPTETVMDDDANVFPGYVYIAYGVFRRQWQWMDEMTVAEWKRRDEIKEVRRCELFEHEGAYLGDRVELVIRSIQTWLAVESCEHGKLYRIHARNFKIGIYNETNKSFVGIRRKFNATYLDRRVPLGHRRALRNRETRLRARRDAGGARSWQRLG